MTISINYTVNTWIKMTIESLKNDLELVKEAISNGDLRDAKQMLNEIFEELEMKTIIL